MVLSIITVLDALLDKCDKVITDGVMVFTFLMAMGYNNVGSCLVKNDFVDTAKKVMAKAGKLGKEIVVPVDAVSASTFDKDADTKIVAADESSNG